MNVEGDELRNIQVITYSMSKPALSFPNALGNLKQIETYQDGTYAEHGILFNALHIRNHVSFRLLVEDS